MCWPLLQNMNTTNTLASSYPVGAITMDANSKVCGSFFLTRKRMVACRQENMQRKKSSGIDKQFLLKTFLCCIG